MRKILILLLSLLISACYSIESGKGMLLTVAPSPTPVLPDLTVSNVRFWWAEQWECGVDVSMTIQNNSDVDVGEFYLSLHDQRKQIPELKARSQITIAITVSGIEVQRWMRATGTVDVDNVILEADESNNDYDQILPYSAVPGMESIVLCYMSQTPPPSATATPTHITVTSTFTPSPTQLPIYTLTPVNNFTPTVTVTPT